MSETVEETSQNGFTTWDTVRLIGRQIGLAADLYLAVVGSALIGLAVAVLLGGFGFVEQTLTESTGATIGGGLVIAVIGLFSLGVASEGPMTDIAYAWPESQLAISRAFGVAAVGVIGLLVAGIVQPFASDVSAPFDLGAKVLRASALAGLVVVLPIGVPGAWYLRREFPIFRVGWDRLVLFALWIVTAWTVVGSTI